MSERLTRYIASFNPLVGLARLILSILNWQRLKITDLDYVMFTLPSAMPPLPEGRNWVLRQLQGDPPMSLAELERAFRRIAEDPRPQGVILYIRGFSMPLADLQTLRASILRLRGKGKKVVCFAHDYDMATYYVASAADHIYLQPGGMLMTLGLRQSAAFLKDALDTVGIQLDVVQIAPFKTAFDTLTRDSISKEAEEQTNWLLDSTYDMLVKHIAEGRGMTVEDVRMMVDTAPHLEDAALEAGYVDGVFNEERLAEHLNIEHVVYWERAQKILTEKWIKRSGRYVALLPITGTIIPGESRRPPGDVPLPIPIAGDEAAGDLTVTQQVRRLMQDERAAAVILFVDSPGGSALASEAMTAALDELAKDRPVVVYMNGVAASGGYYIATAGRWIVAQPGTITGSIGVITGKPVTAEAFKKLRINRMEFSRGENISLLSDSQPFTEAQREQQWDSINHLYQLFIGRVAASRNMTVEEVDAISGGRVWTGQQAFENGLVDELGDIRTALDKARELAKLPDTAPLVLPQTRRRTDPLPAQLAKDANPAAYVNYVYDNIRELFNTRGQYVMPFTINYGEKKR